MLTSIIFAAVFYAISWVIQKAAGRSSSKADKVNNNVFVFSFIGLSLWDISSSLFTYIDYFEEYGNSALTEKLATNFGKKLFLYGIVIVPLCWSKKSLILAEIIKPTGNVFKKFSENIKEVKNSFKSTKAIDKKYAKKLKSKIKSEDYEGSIKEAKKAIKINPKNLDAYYYLVLSKICLEDVKGAIKSANKALKINPRDNRFYYFLSISKYDLEDYEAALVDIDKCIDLSSEYGDYYTHRGDIKRELKDFYSAINDYSKAIKLNPDDSENYRSRGLAKDWSGDLEGTISDWEKAVELGDDELREWIEEKKESLDSGEG